MAFPDEKLLAEFFLQVADLAGEGIRKSGVPRSEIFVQTKLYPNQYGHAEKAIDEALRKLEHFQSDLMDRHYDEVENMYRTMRGWRHDYHNHIQAMKA